MKYRLLGRTGLSVSEVGVGGAGIGQVWGATTEAECIRLVRRAVELGINFFDTSPMYGRGKSEEILGHGLDGLRDRVYIATKVRLQTAEDLADMAGAVRRSVEQSLRRLRTDHVDVLQIHHQLGPDGGQYLAAVGPPPRYAYRLTREQGLELGHAMQRVIEQGKAPRFAIANPAHAPYGRAAEQALRKHGLWDGLQPSLVLGENVTQAAQFATTGNAVGGVVAYSLALAPAMQDKGTHHLIPADDHQPLRQRMVLLSKSDAVAERFYRYLQQPAARTTLARYGFTVSR